MCSFEKKSKKKVLSAPRFEAGRATRAAGQPPTNRPMALIWPATPWFHTSLPLDQTGNSLNTCYKNHLQGVLIYPTQQTLSKILIALRTAPSNQLRHSHTAPFPQPSGRSQAAKQSFILFPPSPYQSTITIQTCCCTQIAASVIQRIELQLSRNILRSPANYHPDPTLTMC